MDHCFILVNFSSLYIFALYRFLLGDGRISYAFFNSTFYIQMPKLTKLLSLDLLVIWIFQSYGLMAFVNGIYLYSMDVVVLAYLVFLVVLINKKTKFDAVAVKSKKKVISIAFISSYGCIDRFQISPD